MYDPIGGLLGAWSAGDGLWAIAFRLALALTFGAVLGCERAAKRHAAGLRTFVLVCMSGNGRYDASTGRAAACRLSSAAVVLGIAIISTNSILFSSKSQIRGLTTATGLWSCSLLGLALARGSIRWRRLASRRFWPVSRGFRRLRRISRTGRTILRCIWSSRANTICRTSSRSSAAWGSKLTTLRQTPPISIPA